MEKKTMTENLKDKAKSWPLWLALAALVVWTVKTTAGIDIGAQVDEFMDLLLAVLVAFGIVNNPNSRDTL